MAIPPSDPRSLFEFKNESENFLFGGTTSKGTSCVREHLCFEVQDGKHGDTCELPDLGGEGATSQNGAVGKGKSPLRQFGVPALDLLKEDGAEVSVDFFESDFWGQSLGFVEMPAIQDFGHALPRCEGKGKTEVGAAKKDGLANPNRGSSCRKQSLSELRELVQVAGGQGSDPAEKVAFDRRAGIGRVHLLSIALSLALTLLLFGCQEGKKGKKGTPIPPATSPVRAKLLGVSYGKEPLRLPDGRTVSRARFQAHVVALRAKRWLFVKAFLASKAKDGKVATQNPVLREMYRTALGVIPAALAFLPEPAGEWSSWTALDDLVSAALLYRNKDEEADFGGAEGARRAFHRMQKAFNKGQPHLLQEGDTLFGVWNGSRVSAALCYPDVLALLTPPERDQALLDLAARIKTRQVPGAGR
jgi:hypothetical protein